MHKIKRIDEIIIKNIKGIDSKNLKVAIFPNMPNILVAPNGFGKSSLALAFDSLTSSKINLPEEYAHNGNPALKPELSILYVLEGGTSELKSADEAKNEISSRFGISVIKNRLVPKARMLQISGRKIAISSLEVSEISLIEKIPDKASIPYSYSEMKAAFGPNGKIIWNLNSILQDSRIMSEICAVDFAKENQVGIKNIVSVFKNQVNLLNGSSANILSSIKPEHLADLENIPHIHEIVLILSNSKYEFANDAEKYCAAVQISDLHLAQKVQFRNLRKYVNYILEKESYIKEFLPFKKTWKNISPREEKGSLVLSFPKANQISNGERDTLCLVAALLKAKRQLKNESSILIIDEVFDYLDDANLIACQYHLTQIIDIWKKENRQIIPVILTHLDPRYFRNFTFKNQKVTYLMRSNKSPEKLVRELISKRGDQSIEDNVSKYFLHFHPQDCDLATEFAALNLDVSISKASLFNVYIKENLNRYISGKSFDPISVCCAVRNLIEEKTYEALNLADRLTFLATHTTVDKLNFALQQGLELPDSYFLLSVIYNDAAHIHGNADIVTPIFSKLDNLTIKTMIRDII